MGYNITMFQWVPLLIIEMRLTLVVSQSRNCLEMDFTRKTPVNWRKRQDWDCLTLSRHRPSSRCKSYVTSRKYHYWLLMKFPTFPSIALRDFPGYFKKPKKCQTSRHLVEYQFYLLEISIKRNWWWATNHGSVEPLVAGININNHWRYKSFHYKLEDTNRFIISIICPLSIICCNVKESVRYLHDRK